MTRLSQSAADRHIIIGRIGAAHGIRGEVRVNPMTDFPERFHDMTAVYVDNALLEIESVRYHGDKILMKFKGYETRNDAETLKGKMLSVPRSEAMPLNEGEYYTFDIIGLDVVDVDGNALGKVTNVLETGSNDVYVVKSDEGKEILVPALKAVVKEINIDESRMVVDLPEVIE